MELTYSIITPARNEADGLPQLASALRSQTRLPVRWVIVENGSSDQTEEVAETIVAECDWARLVVLPGPGRGSAELPSSERSTPVFMLSTSSRMSLSTSTRT